MKEDIDDLDDTHKDRPLRYNQKNFNDKQLVSDHFATILTDCERQQIPCTISWAGTCTYICRSSAYSNLKMRVSRKLSFKSFMHTQKSRGPRQILGVFQYLCQ